MRRLLCFAALAAIAGAGGLWLDESRAQVPDAKGTTVTIKMLDGDYSPKEATAKAGDSVVWVNEGKRVHTATSDNEGKTFDTGDVKPGAKSKPVKIAAAGTVKYHCEHHPKMVGSIAVKK